MRGRKEARSPEEVEAEIRFHIEMRARALERQGMEPDEARREALRRFGDPDAVRDRLLSMARRREAAAHGREWWDEVFRELRFAARQLLKHPAGSLAGLLTLALAIGAATAVFSVVDAVLLAPLPFQEPDRLVVVEEVDPDRGTRMDVSAPAFRDFRYARSLEGIAVWLPGEMDLLREGRPSRVRVAKVSRAFFSVLGLPPAQGRGFLPGEDTPGGEAVVVLSGRLARESFGGASSAVGASVVLDGLPRTVVGVADARLDLPAGTDAWVPLFGGPGFDVDIRGAKILPAVARLADEVTLEGAREELTGINRRAADSDGYGAALTPLRDRLVGDVDGPLLLLLGAVLLVLLAACASVGNLLLSRSMARRRELAVRAALGASRRRVVTGLLAEGVLLAAAAGVLGLVVARTGADLLVRWAPAELPRTGDVGLDGRVLLFGLAGALLTGVLAGALPAARARVRDLGGRLREGDARHGTDRASGRVRAALVVGQMVATLVLLAGAGLLAKSFVTIVGQETGFDAGSTAVVAFDLPAYRYGELERVTEFQHRLVERVADLPGVEGAGLSRNLPLTGRRMTSPVLREGEQTHDGRLPQAHVSWVTPGYFEAMGVEVVEGRRFGREDAAEGRRVMLVNETFARTYFPDGSVPGRRARSYFTPELHEIVGVVEDVRHGSMTGEPRPLVYHLMGSAPARGFHMVARTAGSPGALFPAVRDVVRALDPELPPAEMATMGELVSRDVAEPRFYTGLLSAFAVVTLLLSVLGLYGVVATGVVQRERELGIRLALGARPGAVGGLVVRRTLALAATGALLGLGAALLVGRVLEGLLYRVTPTDPWVLAGVSAAFLGACLVAVIPTVVRAARVDPAEVLRS